MDFEEKNLSAQGGSASGGKDEEILATSLNKPALFKILVDPAISRYGKKRKKWQAESTDPLDLELASERNLSTEDIVLESETKSIVSDALNCLPEPMAKLVSLYYIEDKPYKAIAEEYSLTIPALKMKLFRAKRMLRKILDEKSYE